MSSLALWLNACLCVDKGHKSQTGTKASRNWGGGSRSGITLSMASTWPSCPQAAISSPPRLSRTVHTAPASRRTSPKAAVCTYKGHPSSESMMFDCLP